MTIIVSIMLLHTQTTDERFFANRWGLIVRAIAWGRKGIAMAVSVKYACYA